MSILRVVVLGAILVYLLFFGGPVLGVMVSTWTFLIPALFLLAVVGLAAWKFGDLVKR